MRDLPRNVHTILYAISGAATSVAADVVHALRRIREAGHRVIVVHGTEVTPEARGVLSREADSLIEMPSRSFRPTWYWSAAAQLGLAGAEGDLVLTGDDAVGPIGDLNGVVGRMADRGLDAWQMVENAHLGREHFPAFGDPALARPWMWTQVSGTAIGSEAWRAFADTFAADAVGAEWRLVEHLAQSGLRTGYAFPASDFPSGDPALLHAPLLLEHGCPFVDKAVFRGYPPHLDRLGVIGRDVAASIVAAGYPEDLLWLGLVRSTPPRVLNTNAGMLEVIEPTAAATGEGPRIAVVVRVSDVPSLDVLLTYLGNIPCAFDLIVTVKDGIAAGRVERRLESWWNEREGRFDVRVTPSNDGRDMADFLIGCRDVLVSDAYDLVFKLTLRRLRSRTVNVARYFRRYQFENLLNDPGHVRGILAMFEREPGLGLVFPPMIHIGYPTMGNGWDGLAPAAQRLSDELGLDVRLDEASPLAPYGGMFIARPTALRALVGRHWTYADYTRAARAGVRLGAVQERLLAPAAAHVGFHTRTVLAPSHAPIVHTSLEYKADEMFSTTRGYPVEQISLLRSAGTTGHGGLASLVRMYVRMNHPRLGRALRPVERGVSRILRGGRRMSRAVSMVRRMIRKGEM